MPGRVDLHIFAAVGESALPRRGIAGNRPFVRPGRGARDFPPCEWSNRARIPPAKHATDNITSRLKMSIGVEAGSLAIVPSVTSCYKAGDSFRLPARVGIASHCATCVWLCCQTDRQATRTWTKTANPLRPKDFIRISEVPHH